MVFSYIEDGKTLYGILLVDNWCEESIYGFKTLKEAQEERDRYFSDENYFERF